METPRSTAHPRITIDPNICHGQPTVRGLRYPVWHVLELLSSMSEAEILADYPDLQQEDFAACQAYAALLLKRMGQALAGDGTRRPVTKQELLAHLIETSKVPPSTILNEQGQLSL